MLSARGAHGAAFAFLLAYAAVMPLVAGGVELWFLPEVVALFERPSMWAVLLVAVSTAVALALMPATAMARSRAGSSAPSISSPP